MLDSSSLFIDAFVLDRLLSYYRQPAFGSNDVLPTVLLPFVVPIDDIAPERLLVLDVGGV